MSSTSSPGAPEIVFGGPDRPPRALRDLLQARVEAVPPGGRVDWATYYFRDGALADALIAASDRGVEVRLCVEGAPRRADVNAAVVARLQAHGLRGGLRVQTPGRLPRLHPHLHLKIYAFSHPTPVAYVGSFNPSGDDPEDADIIAEIGDQDRGHNLLIGFGDPALHAGLAAHVGRLARAGASGFDRFRASQNRPLVADGTAIYFFPRLNPAVIDRDIAAAGVGSRIRGAISHLKTGPLADALIAAARRGADVRLLVHDTERRVPAATVARLAAGRVAVARYVHPQGLPLHAKFLLIEGDGAPPLSAFGSFNFNPRSRHLNHELLVRSTDPRIAAALGARFEAIAAEAASYGR